MKKTMILFILLAMPTIAEETSTPEFLSGAGIYPNELPFSEAVRVGNTFYLSGQIGVLPGTLKLVDGGVLAETKQTMENLKSTLESNGLDMDNVIKCLVMMADISEWGVFNGIYKSYFSDHFPARSALGVNGLALGARVEVECIAVGH